MDDEFGTKFETRDSCVSINKHWLIAAEAEILADGLHVERRVEIPVFAIFITAVGNSEKNAANDGIGVDGDVKKSRASFFRGDRSDEDVRVSFCSVRHQVLILVNLNYF